MQFTVEEQTNKQLFFLDVLQMSDDKKKTKTSVQKEDTDTSPSCYKTHFSQEKHSDDITEMRQRCELRSEPTKERTRISAECNVKQFYWFLEEMQDQEAKREKVEKCLRSEQRFRR